MPDDPTPKCHVFEYEGFEIHALPQIKAAPESASNSYLYIAYVCRPGAHADTPGDAVHFHSDGDDAFKTPDDAADDARHVGRSIVDGTHPDLNVLPLVSHHHHTG
ncbi:MULTISPECIES: hypothetical protein [unclassified Caballeronia]|uniref:hypothetical protein n=1 Tax=unclassified Caballeronia TaxID=2646786 RepID=UPI00202926E3|nr:MULTISPECIES: hypothetical protein [unclassified Caballeronia]